MINRCVLVNYDNISIICFTKNFNGFALNAKIPPKMPKNDIDL